MPREDHVTWRPRDITWPIDVLVWCWSGLEYQGEKCSHRGKITQEMPKPTKKEKVSSNQGKVDVLILHSIGKKDQIIDNFSRNRCILLMLCSAWLYPASKLLPIPLFYSVLSSIFLPCEQTTGKNSGSGKNSGKDNAENNENEVSCVAMVVLFVWKPYLHSNPIWRPDWSFGQHDKILSMIPVK